MSFEHHLTLLSQIGLKIITQLQKKGEKKQLHQTDYHIYPLPIQNAVTLEYLPLELKSVAFYAALKHN